jgi:hypothetical protein
MTSFQSSGMPSHRKSKHCLDARAAKLSRSEPQIAVAEKDCAGPMEPQGIPAAGVAPAPVGTGLSLKPERVTRELTLGALDMMPPVYAKGESEDVVMGRQLKEQAEKIAPAAREMLIFAGMLLTVRARVNSAAELTSRPKRGPGSHDGSFKQWMETYAPTVSLPTAYRFLEIADGLVDEFKLGKKADLKLLLSAPVEQLSKAQAAKRREIEECVEGRSQRQLLLTFGKKTDGRAKNPGGFRPNALMLRGWLEKEFPDNPEYYGAEFYDLPEDVQKRFKREGERYFERLTKAERQELEDAEYARQCMAEATEKLGAWTDLWQMERAEEAALEELNRLANDFRAKINAAQALLAKGAKPKAKALPNKK